MPGLIQVLTADDLDFIHASTLRVLGEEGVLFRNDEAIALFKKHGFKIDGYRVLINEDQADSALSTVPHAFTLKAFNKSNSLTIDTTSMCFVPGCGAPYISDKNGVRRKGTLADYIKFCQLVHTSDVIDLSGFLMVDICDRPAESAHLYMLYSTMCLCDKPYLGFPSTRRATDDSIAMARIVWGDSLPPVMMALINGMAPMQFSDEMAYALMAFAKAGQPLIITGGGIMGATAPIRLPGLLVVQNAAILAAIVLTQLIKPGSPVVYGATGTSMDMRTGAYLTARPEFSMAAGLGTQVARFYGIPCRGGGAVTDSHLPDIQAGMESALTLAAAIDSGINVILLACGMLGTLMAMSFEKFITDEALCRMFAFMKNPIAISDETVDLKSIFEVGAGGQYITHSQTFLHCRTAFYQSALINSTEYNDWCRMGGQRMEDAAADAIDKRLESYKHPEMDHSVKTALDRYVDKNK